MPNPQPPNTSDDRIIRDTLAKTVLYISLGTVVVLSLAGMGLGYVSKDAFESSKFVLSSVLPLLGAWVGTLLAYYFSKQNFEAATKSVTELAKELSGTEKLKVIPVKEKMRPLSAITFWELKPGDEDKCKLSDVLKMFVRVERIPFLDDQRRILYLAYKSTIYEFLGRVALDPVATHGKAAADLTLKDLLAFDPKLKSWIQGSFGFVAESATLAEAKEMMDAVSKVNNCDDVFVTKTGKREEPILGWVTNNAIAANARL